MSSSNTEQLSRDEVYDILSNARRRFVIYFLRDRREPVELSELSDRVAAWENDVPVEELTDQQVKRVYVSLYQTHIPKLEDTGIVEYDSDSGVRVCVPCHQRLCSSRYWARTAAPNERNTRKPTALSADWEIAPPAAVATP